MKSSPLALWGAVLGLSLAPLAAMAQQAAPAPAVITVTGEGRTDVAPDMATVTMGVTSRGETAAEALAANNAQMEKILAALAEAGIAPRDIQTSSVNLLPVWDDHRSDGSPARMTGYEVSNQVTVRVRELPALGKVLDNLVAVGVNQLYGLNFGLLDPQPAMDAARADAVSDARRKAGLLAAAAGLDLGGVRVIVEGGSGHGGPMVMFARDGAASGGQVPVAEGELSISATVTVTWELIPG